MSSCVLSRGKGSARAAVHAHRVHSCAMHSIRERAFLILGELRHRTAACRRKAPSRLSYSALYTARTHTEGGLKALLLRDLLATI